MTKQEQQKMQRLELENEMLRRRNAESMRIYGDNLIQIIELKATIELIKSAIGSQNEIPKR